MNQLMNFLQAASNTAASNVSGPVDLIAEALRAAGVPVPRNALLSSEWMREKGLTAPVQQGASQVAGDTLGLLAPVAAAAKAPQIARGLLKVGENAAAPKVINRGGAAGQRGIFMGDLSKTWDSAAAAKAEAMEKAGKDARAIWNETGTFRGVDGKWRQEIDDSAAEFHSFFKQPTADQFQETVKLRAKIAAHDAELAAARKAPGFSIESFYSTRPGAYEDYWSAKKQVAAYDKAINPPPKTGPLGQFLEHDRLSAAYPWADDIPTTHNLSHSGGSYSPGMNSLLVGGGNEKSIALHELQHAIQERQGFARGGSPDMMGLILESEASKKQSEAKRLMDLAMSGDPLNPGKVLKPGARAKSLAAEKKARELKALADRIDEFGPGFAQDAYRRLAGEAEARAVQSRMNLTPAQRRALFPLDSYDVPLNELIVR